MKTNIQSFWESLRSSYWFIPSLMVIFAFGLSFLTQQLDDRFQFQIGGAFPGVFQGGPDGARSMLATIAGSMITVASVTFSITIAALANASSQFGPRLLRIFMQDTGSQIVLGTFVGTFIYCLMALRLVPVEETTDYVPHLSTSMALVLALASIGVLIFFIHHMATMLQVSNVTARVGEEMIESINSLFPEDLGWGGESDERPDAVRLSEMSGSVVPDSNQRGILAERIGYIRAIDEETLMELAVDHDVVIRIALRPGVFIVPDALLAVVWPSERATKELSGALQEVFLVGSGRTPFQDIELYFDELIEIALRALSPGINDPYTAFTCIDWLTAGVTSLANLRMPSRYRYDRDGELRIIADNPQMDELIDRIFDRIRNAGAGHPSVLRKLLEAAITIGPLLDEREEVDVLRRQLAALDEVVRSAPFVEHERRELTNRYRDAIHALGSTR
ncbi:MAG: DUF2254 domain-containing protein [Thermomicrobiales bacterium]